MHFGATLRLLRVDAGLTLRELADRIGVSNAYLSRVENGHDAPPTPDRLAAIARAFRLSPTTLVELADRVGPIAADYFETVPGARELMMEVVRRRLSPVQIARIRAFVDREFPTSDEASRSLDLSTMFNRSRVILGLSCTDLEDVLDIASTRFTLKEQGRASELADHIAQRERACSSTVGSGLAVPHALRRDFSAQAVVVVLKRPLPLQAPDGLGVRVFVVHIHPGGSDHTTMLAHLARLADPTLVARVAGASSPSEVVRLLAERLG